MEKKLLIFSSDATKSHHTISHFAHLKINKIELNYTIHASANGLLNEKMKKRKLAKIMMQTIIKKRQLVCVFCIRFNASRTTSLQVCCESAPPNDCTKRRKSYAWDLACSQNEENYSTVFFLLSSYLFNYVYTGRGCVCEPYLPCGMQKLATMIFLFLATTIKATEYADHHHGRLWECICDSF